MQRIKSSPVRSGMFERLISRAAIAVAIVVPTAVHAGPGLLPPPGVQKAFSPALVQVGQTSVLTITLANPNNQALTGVTFTDTYPANLVNAAMPAASTTCGGGIVGAVASGTSVALAGGTIAANASCTVTVTVISNTPGSPVNIIAAGAVTSTNGAPNVGPAIASLVVNFPGVPPAVSKSIFPGLLMPGQIALMTITLGNGNQVPLTGVQFTDTYPTGLVNANPPMPARLGRL